MEHFSNNDKILLSNIEAIEDTIMEKKQSKFERDRLDYERNQDKTSSTPKKSILKSKYTDTSSYESDTSENENKYPSVSFDITSDTWRGKSHSGHTARDDAIPSTSGYFSQSTRPQESKNYQGQGGQRGRGGTRGAAKRKKYT
ncbi:hypothetical protein FKM82_029836 [Ascaphus truei]